MWRQGLIAALFLSLVTLLGGPGSPPLRAGERPLQVIAWPESFSPHALRSFGLFSGVRVEFTWVESAEALLRALARQPSGGDLVLAPDYLIPLLLERGALAPLDHDRLLHLRDLDPRFETRPDDPGHRHSIPLMWGTTGIAWRADQVPIPLNSWAQVFDPKARWAGHVALVGDAREALGAALKSLGYSANSTSAAEVDAARQLLLSQPKLSIHRGDEAAGRMAFGASWVSQLWSDDLARLRSRGAYQVQYTVPVEGGILWLDALGIVSDSEQLDAAYRFLNYVTHPRMAAQLTAMLRCASPSLGARAHLPADIRDDPTVYPPTDRLDRSEFIRDVGAATATYDRAWADVLRHAGIRSGVRRGGEGAGAGGGP